MRISDWSSDVCDCERFGHSRHQAGRDRPPAGRPTDRLETLGFRDFPPVVVTAGRADMMRALQLTAARAFVIAARREGIVRPAHVTPRFSNFSLRKDRKSTRLNSSH